MRWVIGLGANLGDREANLREAVRALSEIARVDAVSRVYETEPVGPPQPKYFNAAALISSDADPHALLRDLHAIEARLCRTRETRWGPRTIDLDILWSDGPAIETDTLVVPHPRLTERAFAMAPLLDLAPDAKDPRSQEKYAEKKFANLPGEVALREDICILQ